MNIAKFNVLFYNLIERDWLFRCLIDYQMLKKPPFNLIGIGVCSRNCCKLKVSQKTVKRPAEWKWPKSSKSYCIRRYYEQELAMKGSNCNMIGSVCACLKFCASTTCNKANSILQIKLINPTNYLVYIKERSYTDSIEAKYLLGWLQTFLQSHRHFTVTSL